MHVSEAPELISAAVTGLGSFILGIPLTPQIARICGPRMADMEAQLEQRKRNPQKVKIK